MDPKVAKKYVFKPFKQSKEAEKGTYKNYKELKLQQPALNLVLGRPKSGKTVCVSNCISKIGFGTLFSFLQRNLNDGSLQPLKDKLKAVGKKMGRSIVRESSDPSVLDESSEKYWKFSPKHQNVLVIDDFVSQMKPKQIKSLNSLCQFHRHRNVTIYFMTQTCFHPDTKFIKDICSDVFFLGDFESRSIREFLKRVNCSGLSIEDLENIFCAIKNRNQYGSLHLDITNPDPNFRIRQDLITIPIRRE